MLAPTAPPTAPAGATRPNTNAIARSSNSNSRGGSTNESADDGTTAKTMPAAASVLTTTQRIVTARTAAAPTPPPTPPPQPSHQTPQSHHPSSLAAKRSVSSSSSSDVANAAVQPTLTSSMATVRPAFLKASGGGGGPAPPPVGGLLSSSLNKNMNPIRSVSSSQSARRAPPLLSSSQQGGGGAAGFSFGGGVGGASLSSLSTAQQHQQRRPMSQQLPSSARGLASNTNLSNGPLPALTTPPRGNTTLAQPLSSAPLTSSTAASKLAFVQKNNFISSSTSPPPSPPPPPRNADANNSNTNQSNTSRAMLLPPLAAASSTSSPATTPSRTTSSSSSRKAKHHATTATEGGAIIGTNSQRQKGAKKSTSSSSTARTREEGKTATQKTSPMKDPNGIPIDTANSATALASSSAPTDGNSENVNTAAPDLLSAPSQLETTAVTNPNLQLLLQHQFDFNSSSAANDHHHHHNHRQHSQEHQHSLTQQRGGGSPSSQHPSQSALYARQREEKLRNNISTTISQLVSTINNTYYNQRVAAAICIQCAWRSSKARLEAFSRRQVFLHFIYLRQKASAICIINFFKSVLLRKRRANIKGRAAEALEKKIASERRQRAAIIKITAAIRRYIVEKKERRRVMRLLRIRQEEKLACYRTAAVIVQRWWRIIIVEKKYWRRVAEAMRMEKAKQEEADRIDRAATNIQRIFRGVVGRKVAVEKQEKARRDRISMTRKIRESVDVVRIFLMSVAAKMRRESTTGMRLIVSPDGATVTPIPITDLKHEQEERAHFEAKERRNNNNANSSNSSATNTTTTTTGTPSAATKGPLSNQVALELMARRNYQKQLEYEATQNMLREAQRLLHQRARLTAKACVTIQHCWRQYRARRDLRVRRTIAKTHTIMRVDREYEQFKATLLVQRMAAALRSSQLVSRIGMVQKERFWSSLYLIQRCGRGYFVRAEERKAQCVALFTANAAIYEATATFNRHVKTLVSFALARQSLCVCEEKKILKRKANEKLMREVKRSLHQDECAATIQRMIRSNLKRRETRARVQEMEEAKRRVLAAVVKIQSFVRAKIFAKKAFDQRKKEFMLMNKHRALELAMTEKALLDFIARFEAIEAQERLGVCRQEEGAWGCLVTMANGNSTTIVEGGGGSEAGNNAATTMAEGEEDFGSDPYDF